MSCGTKLLACVVSGSRVKELRAFFYQRLAYLKVLQRSPFDGNLARTALGEGDWTRLKTLSDKKSERGKNERKRHLWAAKEADRGATGS